MVTREDITMANIVFIAVIKIILLYYIWDTHQNELIDRKQINKHPGSNAKLRCTKNMQRIATLSKRNANVSY